MTDCIMSPWAMNAEHRTCGFGKFCGTPEKKTKLMYKFKVPKKKGIKRGSELTEKRIASALANSYSQTEHDIYGTE